MIKHFIAAVISALSFPALAQTAVQIAPYPLRGQGVATASTSSATIIATLALTANSKAFPTNLLEGTLTIQPQTNAATGVYVCWQGGTCTAAIGEYLAPGQSHTVALATNMLTSPPTIISTGTPAVVVEW